MFKHYVLTALRNLSRFKATTAINVVGLALGLACLALALGTVTYWRSGDRHLPNAERIMVITERGVSREQGLDTGKMTVTSAPVAKFLPIDAPELEAVARARNLRDLPVVANDRTFSVRSAAADREFLDIFRFAFASASASNPLSVPRGVVISEDLARKFFGTTAALGRTLSLQNSIDVTVTGVMKPIPQPSHIGNNADYLLGARGGHFLSFDLLMTEETWDDFRRVRMGGQLPAQTEAQAWTQPNRITYALLPADGSLTATMLNDRLERFARHIPRTVTSLTYEYEAVSLSSLRLAKMDADLFLSGRFSMAPVLLTLAAIVLGLAALNYANLAIAQAMTRAREISVRRVLGARPWQIFIQQLCDCALQVVPAIALAMVLAVYASKVFAPQESGIGLAVVASSVSFWLVTLGILASVTIVLSMYTAFATVKVQPIEALRGSVHKAATGRAARWLVGVQFAAATILIVGLLAIQSQHRAMREQALQPDSDPVVMLAFARQGSPAPFEAFRSSLLQSPAIRSVSLVTNNPWSKYGGSSAFARERDSTPISAIASGVRHEFDETLDMRLLAGRSFAPTYRKEYWTTSYVPAPGDTHEMVIDRSMARQFGFSDPTAAIGQRLHAPHGLTGTPLQFEIIGVVEDKPLRLEPLHGATGNTYLLASDDFGTIVARIDRRRVKEGLAAIDSTWKALLPNTPINRHFLDELFEQEYAAFASIGTGLTMATLTGLFIAAMGLFGMATFVAGRRRHEIGVRKTLGASAQQVLMMLIRDFSKPVLIAGLLAWPLAYLAVQRYLDIFIQRIELSATPFLVGLAITLVIAWVAVGGQAWTAAQLRPANVLRHE